MDMFDMAFELGANFRILNRQGLSPLTVAAFLAHTDMFFHVLNIDRDIYWQIGHVVCAAYPLTVLDTIDVQTGELNVKSALNLIVFGVTSCLDFQPVIFVQKKPEHLDMIEGVVVDCLRAKWKAFIGRRCGL